MSQFTDGLGMPFLTPGLSGHIPHNDALIILDEIVGRGIKEATHVVPTSPVEWDMYIVWAGKAPGGAGDIGIDWAGNENSIAIFYNNAWRFVVPKHGCRVWNRQDKTIWVFGTSTWSVLGSGQACAVIRSTANRDSTSLTWVQVDCDSSVLVPSNSFEKGSGVGDIRLFTAGTYMLEFQAAVQVTSANVTSIQVGFSVSSSASGTTPDTNSLRIQTLNNVATLHDRQIVHAQYVCNATAGHYVAPLFRNYGLNGVTAAHTVRILANENHFRVTKLNP